MGDVGNLLDSLLDIPLNTFHGTVDIGGRLDPMYKRYVIPKMVLSRDGRILFATAEGNVIIIEQDIRKHRVSVYRHTGVNSVMNRCKMNLGLGLAT